jgi:F420-0:gamma-glutamyl ligase-like protein
MGAAANELQQELIQAVAVILALPLNDGDAVYRLLVTLGTLLASRSPEMLAAAQASGVLDTIASRYSQQPFPKMGAEITACLAELAALTSA